MCIPILSKKERSIIPRDSPQLRIANMLNDETGSMVKVRLIGGPNVNIVPETRAVKISVGSSRHVYCTRKHVAVIHPSFRSSLKVSRSPGYTIMFAGGLCSDPS